MIIVASVASARQPRQLTALAQVAAARCAADPPPPSPRPLAGSGQTLARPRASPPSNMIYI
jgi:hypothetical protein